MTLACMLTLVGMAREAGAGAYTPPQDVYVTSRAMEAISADIAGGRPSDAVARIEGLYNDPSSRLVRVDDNRILSVREWVDSQLTDSIFPTRFREQYEKVVGQAAQNALADATHAGDVPAMLAVAERYPWTTAAREAPIAAVQRLLALGDVRGAKDLLARIPEADIPPALRSLANIPDDGTLEPAAFSTTFLRTKGVPLSPLSPPAHAPRLVPVASNDAIYLASPMGILALSHQGRLLWKIMDPAPELPEPPKEVPKSMEQFNPADTSLSRAAVWCDPSGTPRVLVARQSTPLKSSLRAVRPADGSIIWTTLTSEQGGELLYVGAPAIAGRYVYSMAIDVDAAVGNKLCLVALELASGRVLFRTEIGAAERRMNAQVRPDGTNPLMRVVNEFVFRDSTVLSVDGQYVYVAPGGGSVWCIERFGGAIRWVATYPVKQPPTPQQEREAQRQRERERQERAKNKLPEPPPIYNVRWQNNVLSTGKAIVVAPTDSRAVTAIDSATGKRLWTTEQFPAAELVTVQDDIVVVADAYKLVGLRLANGEPAWETPLPVPLTGPAFVEGDSVGVLAGGVATLYAIRDGQPVQRDSRRPVLDTLLRMPAARTHIQAADLFRYFGEPPALPEKPRPGRPEKAPPKEKDTKDAPDKKTRTR